LASEGRYEAGELHGIERTYFEACTVMDRFGVQRRVTSKVLDGGSNCHATGKLWHTTEYDHGRIVWLEEYPIFVGLGTVTDRRNFSGNAPEQVFRKNGKPLTGLFRECHVFAPGWMAFELKDGIRHGGYWEFDGEGNLTRTLAFDKSRRIDGDIPEALRARLKRPPKAAWAACPKRPVWRAGESNHFRP
jgi:hypothetical protein